jgi:hypothetical protein
MFDPFTYLKNKKCLLIGNAVLDKEPNYSDYEVIIRMNLGIMTKPCDVWIDNLVNQAHSFLLDKLGYYPEIKNIIRLNAEKNGNYEWNVCLVFINHMLGYGIKKNINQCVIN